MSDSNIDVKMRVKTLNKMKSEPPRRSNLPDDKKAASLSMRMKSFDKQMSDDEHQRRTYSDDKMDAPFSTKVKSLEKRLSIDVHQSRTYRDDKMAAPVSMRVKSFDKKMSEDEHQPRTYSDDKMAAPFSMRVKSMRDKKMSVNEHKSSTYSADQKDGRFSTRMKPLDKNPYDDEDQRRTSSDDKMDGRFSTRMKPLDKNLYDDEEQRRTYSDDKMDGRFSTRMKPLDRKMYDDEDQRRTYSDDKMDGRFSTRMKPLDKNLYDDEDQRRTYSDDKMDGRFSTRMKPLDKNLYDDEEQRRTYSDDKMDGRFSTRMKPLDRKMYDDEDQRRTYSDDKLDGRFSTRMKPLDRKMYDDEDQRRTSSDDKMDGRFSTRMKPLDKKMYDDEDQCRTSSDDKMDGRFSMRMKPLDKNLYDDEDQRRTYSDDKIDGRFSTRMKPLDRKMYDDEHQRRTYNDDKMGNAVVDSKFSQHYAKSQGKQRGQVRNEMEGPNMEVPMPFITTDASGKLHVNSDVMQVLSQARQPVSIVSVVGKYRTGKSYILNRFFNENAGFSLGETIQSKTKGIWIWARPHPLDPKRTLLLLDTEGLHDVEKGDETHDMQLFSLSLLLSNCLVYNATGALDDTMVQQLHLVTNLTKRIKIRESDDDSSVDFSLYFPAFFLLLRDFFLELILNGKECTPNEYMENALKFKKGASKKIDDYNLPRQCIRQYFPVRKCHTLCKPVDNDKQLRYLDKVQEGGIKEEFLEAAENAIYDILQEAKPFSVNGQPINGPSFIKLAGTYVDVMNDNGIPCISSAMDLLKKTECQKALEEALSTFSDIMDIKLKDNLPVNQDSLSKAQKTALAAALEHYDANSLFDDEGKFMADLLNKLDKKYKVYIELNIEMSMIKCAELLEKCFENVDRNIDSGEYMITGGHDMYTTDREQALKEYKKVAKNILMAEDTLSLFLEDRKTEENSIINADKALGEKEKQHAKEQEEPRRQEERAKAAESEKERLEADNLRKEEESAEMIKKFQEDMDKRDKEMAQEHDIAMEKQKSEYNRMKRQGEEKQAEAYQEARTKPKSAIFRGLAVAGEEVCDIGSDIWSWIKS